MLRGLNHQLSMQGSPLQRPYLPKVQLRIDLQEMYRVQFGYSEGRSILVGLEHLQDSMIPNIHPPMKPLHQYKRREIGQVLVSKQQMQAQSLLHWR